jgi:hypothetical protein
MLGMNSSWNTERFELVRARGHLEVKISRFDDRGNDPDPGE